MSRTADGNEGLLALWIGPLLALLLYLPSLWGTFLVDDFLVNSMLAHGAEPRLAWGEIFADFGRSWVGLEGSHLYRPLVSIAFGLTYAIDGANPLPFHATNILFHVGATLACALLCRTCSPARPAFAAALGGAIFALHPIGAEPTCWIASRTTGLQVMFALWSMFAFARHVQGGGRAGYAACILFLVASLLCKESAVMLPVSFVFLDLLLRGVQPGKQWRTHLVTCGVVAAYFLARRLLLGQFVGASAAGVSSDDTLGVVLAKFAALAWPVGNSMPGPWGLFCGLFLALGLARLLLPALLGPTTWYLVLPGILWIGLQFLPTYRMAIDPSTLNGSRMLYSGLAVFAVCASVAATRALRGRTARLACWVVVLGLASLGTARMTQYLRTYEAMRHLRSDLSAAQGRASVGRPLATVNISGPREGIPFLNCNAVYPLTEKPFAAQDTPLVGLGFLWQKVPRSEHLLFDMGPWRALREQGALLLEWHDAAVPPRLEVQTREDATPAPLPDLRRAGSGRFLAPSPIDTRQVEAAEIVVRGTCRGGRLAWLYPGQEGPAAFSEIEVPAYVRGAPKTVAFAAGSRRGEHTVFFVDLSHSLTFLAQRRLGGLAGLEVKLDSETAEAVELRLLRRVDPLPLTGRLDDARVPLAKIGTRLTAPELPPGAAGMDLYLLGPDTTLTVAVTPGPVVLPEDTLDAITVILRFSRQKRYYYYFEARGRRTWRSAVDWLRFE